jgi:putative transposase
MPYWQLFYHIVWTTKNREALITPEVESSIYGYLQDKALGLDAEVYALNGTLDHIHMVGSIPPKMAVSKFVGQIKAVSSVKFNQSNVNAEPFAWQDEFGVFSFDRKRLPYVVAYVQNQKSHHAMNNLIPSLERDLPVDVFREAPASYNAPYWNRDYLAFDEDWWRDMLDLG